MKTRLKIWMIVTNVIWGLLFIGSLLPVALSSMLFDAPGSEDSFFTQLAAIAILSFPLTTLASIIGSWISYKKEKYKWVIIFIILPILSILLIILSVWLIELKCGGKLVC